MNSFPFMLFKARLLYRLNSRCRWPWHIQLGLPLPRPHILCTWDNLDYSYYHRTNSIYTTNGLAIASELCIRIWCHLCPGCWMRQYTKGRLIVGRSVCWTQLTHDGLIFMSIRKFCCVEVEIDAIRWHNFGKMFSWSYYWVFLRTTGIPCSIMLSTARGKNTSYHLRRPQNTRYDARI